MKNNKMINSDSEYNQVVAKIDSLMAKGSKNVSADELDEIRQLALAAQDFEQKNMLSLLRKRLLG